MSELNSEGRSGWRPIFEISTTALLVLAALALVWANRSRILPQSDPIPAPPLSVPSNPVSIAGSPALGSPSAHVAIVEFSEFECPYCAEVERSVMPSIRRDYVDKGVLLIVAKQYPLPKHKYAGAAARSALCADAQHGYWPLHDLLFANQDRLAEIDFVELAHQVGLDMVSFDACRKGKEVADRLEVDRKQGVAVGLTATPTFLFGRIDSDRQMRVSEVLVGAKPLAVFKAVLNKVLARPFP